MFGVGPVEFMVVLVLALIVFGPEKLPELMRSAGHAIREFQRYSSELTSTFQETTAEFTSAMDVSDVASDVTSAVQDAVDSVTVNGTASHQPAEAATYEPPVEVPQVSATAAPSEYETAAAMLEPVAPFVEPEPAPQPVAVATAEAAAEPPPEPAPTARRTRKKPAVALTEGIPVESVGEPV